MNDIQVYIYENLFPPDRSWPDKWFKERSYSRWVVYELLERIRNSSDTTPVYIMEQFLQELEYYEDLAEDSGNKNTSYIFRTAKNEILDMLMFYTRKEK